MTRVVLYFTDSSVFGGAEQALLNLMAGLDRGLWRPVLVHHPGAGIDPLVRAASRLGVRTAAIPRMRGYRGAAHLPAFVRRLRAERPDVFHAHLVQPLACMYGRVGAVLAGVPAIVATEHLFVDVPWRFPVLLERLLSTRVDRYLTVSRENAGRLHEVFGFPWSKLRVVHNGIPLSSFEPSPGMTRCAGSCAKGRPQVVLTVARLHEQKGLSHLLDAAALVPDARFLLAGEGPERRSLEAQARTLGLAARVEFMGYREDIADVLAGCDVFVLPSLFEGLPLSVLEAMAAGKPVVATDVGGTGEAVVHGETGLLVRPADATGLAAAIRMVLADPALARRLALAGRARVAEQFSVEGMVRHVTSIYDEILASVDTCHGGR